MMETHWQSYGYTVPNADVYPWQWLWDSCFHALIWHELGEPERALTELRSLFAAPHPTGFVPHMRYIGRPDASVEFWGRRGASSITQPPMYGHALAQLDRAGVEVDDRLVASARDGLDFLLSRRRRLDGLPVLCHPWESGADDSPRWDAWCPDGRFDRGAWRRVKGELVRSIVHEVGAPVHNPDFRVASVGFAALVAFNAQELSDQFGVTYTGDVRAIVDGLTARWDEEHATWVDVTDHGNGELGIDPDRRCPPPAPGHRAQRSGRGHRMVDRDRPRRLRRRVRTAWCGSARAHLRPRSLLARTVLATVGLPPVGGGATPRSGRRSRCARRVHPAWRRALWPGRVLERRHRGRPGCHPAVVGRVWRCCSTSRRLTRSRSGRSPLAGTAWGSGGSAFSGAGVGEGDPVRSRISLSMSNSTSSGRTLRRSGSTAWSPISSASSFLPDPLRRRDCMALEAMVASPASAIRSPNDRTCWVSGTGSVSPSSGRRSSLDSNCRPAVRSSRGRSSRVVMSAMSKASTLVGMWPLSAMGTRLRPSPISTIGMPVRCRFRKPNHMAPRTPQPPARRRRRRTARVRSTRRPPPAAPAMSSRASPTDCAGDRLATDRSGDRRERRRS